MALTPGIDTSTAGCDTEAAGSLGVTTGLTIHPAMYGGRACCCIHSRAAASYAARSFRYISPTGPRPTAAQQKSSGFGLVKFVRACQECRDADQECPFCRCHGKGKGAHGPTCDMAVMINAQTAEVPVRRFDFGARVAMADS